MYINDFLRDNVIDMLKREIERQFNDRDLDVDITIHDKGNEIDIHMDVEHILDETITIPIQNDIMSTVKSCCMKKKKSNFTIDVPVFSIDAIIRKAKRKLR